MTTIIVGLTGLAKSGKDTSADYLVATLNDQGISAIKIALADRLKMISQCLVKLFYDIDIPLEDFYDDEKKDMIYPDYPFFDGQPFRLRNILQKVGTQCLRKFLWSSIWCDYLKRNYLTNNQYQVVVLSDFRFPDEVSYFTELAQSNHLYTLISARVLRENRTVLASNNQMHESEIYILNLPVQYEFENDGTKEQLYQELDITIISKIKQIIS